MHCDGPNHPLHGVKLEQILTTLQAHYGWSELADRVRINCFALNPSVKSSITFLRTTPWALEKVQELYVRLVASES